MNDKEEDKLKNENEKTNGIAAAAIEVQEYQEEGTAAVDELEAKNNELEMALFNKILMGAFDDTIPEPKRKLVRIFTSSTFTGEIFINN